MKSVVHCVILFAALWQALEVHGERFDGHNQQFSGDKILVHGNNNKLTGNHVTGVGNNLQVTGEFATVDGQNARISGGNADVTGNGARVRGTGNTRVEGNNADVTADKALVLGHNAKVVSRNATVRGNNADIAGDGAVVEGNNAKVVGNDAFVYGNNGRVRGDRALISGSYPAVVGDNAFLCTDIGDKVTVRGRNLVINVVYKYLGLRRDLQSDEYDNKVTVDGDRAVVTSQHVRCKGRFIDPESHDYQTVITGVGVTLEVAGKVIDDDKFRDAHNDITVERI